MNKDYTVVKGWRMKKNRICIAFLCLTVFCLATSTVHGQWTEVDLCTFPDTGQAVPEGTVLADQWRPIGILFDATPSSVDPVMRVWGVCYLFFNPDVYGVNAVFSFVDPGTSVPINAFGFTIDAWYHEDESAQLVGLDKSGNIVAQDQITPADIGLGNVSLGMTITGSFHTVEWRTQGDPGIAASSIKFELEPDSDGDGLYDSWERDGIDVNDDGMVDLDLPSMGADPDHKDIFVEVDLASGKDFPEMAKLKLYSAFTHAPVGNPNGINGITLHIDEDENNLNVSEYMAFDVNGWAPEFDTLKSSHFGTPSERSHINQEHILEAKKSAFRYCIFARNSVDGTTGRAERPGNDFFLTLDALSIPDDNVVASIFMHELGHTFGLNHGGRQDDDTNFKPNYVSVMNYALMNPQMFGQNFLDYSRHELPPLNELDLDESIGITVPFGAYTGLFMPYWYWDNVGDRDVEFAYLNGSIVDWDKDGEVELTVNADLNYLGPTSPVNNIPSPGETLRGHNDWANLIYNFRRTAAYGAGIHGDHTDTEITQTILTWMEENIIGPRKFPWPMFMPAIQTHSQQ
jgi:hypothetical protein